jgi:hypothetical protein
MAQLRIEGFPDELLRAVKSKAAAEGLTLKNFMIDAARDALERTGMSKYSEARIDANRKRGKA